MTRVIEKPRHTRSRLKGAGLHLFDPGIIDAIRRAPRTAMRDGYEPTDAVEVMIGDGNDARVSTCIGDDIDLTSRADLLHRNLPVARRPGAAIICADSAELHPGLRLDRAVIGARVRARQPIRIRRSVLPEDAVVNTDRDIGGMEILRGRSVAARRWCPHWPPGLYR